MALNTTPGDDCESLCTVAEANDYHEKRGNVAAWVTLETTRKEELLRDAYDFLLGVYCKQWPETETFGTVGGVIMRGARDACARLALHRLDGPLDAEIAPQVTEQTVGPITTKYAAKPVTASRRQYPDVARLMAPYLVPLNVFSIRMIRA
jgi:hypothetical protein